MNSKRVYFVLLGIIGLLIIGLIGGAYSIDRLLQQQSARLATLKSQAGLLDQQQHDLAKAKKDIQKYQSLDEVARAIVPQDKDQAQTVREIVKIANESGIQLSAFNFPSSSLGQTPSRGSTSTAAPKLSQLKPVANINGVYNLQIVIKQDQLNPVTYPQFMQFLTGLENNRRTAQVSAITLSPDTKNRDLLTFTLTLDEYIKP